MEKVLKVTNALLAVIAVCLVLIVAKVYKVEMPAAAQADPSNYPKYYTPGLPQPVVLFYYPKGSKTAEAVVGEDGKVPTK